MKKALVKLFRINLVLLLCLSLLAGCGNPDADQAGTSQSGSAQAGSSQTGGQAGSSLPGKESSASSGTGAQSGAAVLPRTVRKIDTDLMSMQFYQGKPVEVRRLKNEKKEPAIQDIYVYDENDNYQLVIQNAVGEYNGKFYLTEEGYCLAIWRNTLVRIEPDGTEVFNKHIENGVVDICQLSDGRIMLIMTDASDKMKLAELNPETGDVTKFDNVALTKDRRQYIAAGENGVLLLNTAGFWEVDTQSGELTAAASWDNYEYTLGFLVQDFRLSENGVAELLLNDKKDTLMPMNLSEGRIIVTLWDLDGSSEYRELADLFNQTNPTYYVEVQEPEEGADVEQFWEKNESALLGGSGADIVTSNAVSDIYSLIQKGIFEDLAPYIENAGIFQEDYFPGAFRLRNDEEVYGISIYGDAEGLALSEQLLEEGEIPTNIETLVDALLNHEGDEVFHSSWGSEQVLNYFLCGSEDLWGMIDWKSGTCDFEGVLFAKMLEAAKLFGNGGVAKQAALAETVTAKFYDMDHEEVMEEKGLIYAGYLLDSGCYSVTNPYVEFAINSSSKNKEGAWEFISFMLSEEVQTSLSYQHEPVHRNAFEAVVKREISEGPSVVERWDNSYSTKAKVEAHGCPDYRAYHTLTEEKTADIKSRLENAVILPLRTEAILDIICEEASAYFNDRVNAADICENIRKKVQQYLDENM